MVAFLLLAACPSPHGPGATEPSPDTGTSPVDTATCVPAADEPPACETASEGEYLQACRWDGSREEEVFTGTFTEFGSGGVWFVADDGTTFDLSGGTGGVWSDLPPLEEAGRVIVHIVGDCGTKGEGTAALMVSTLDGDLLLLTGRGPGPWAIGDWSATRVAAGCGERDADATECTACQAPQPVAVTGPESVEAWPGHPEVSGSYRLVVGKSYEGRVYVCADGPGLAFAFWYLVAG